MESVTKQTLQLLFGIEVREWTVDPTLGLRWPRHIWNWSFLCGPCLSYGPAATAKSLQSCPTLCDPIDRSPPGSPVPGILQARTLEWVAISFSNAWKWKVKAKSCLTLHNPRHRSLPDSSIHGIFQARVLEWVGSKCRIPFQVWYMRGNTTANLAMWISAGPKHRDFTNSKWDSKLPGTKRADKTKRETP